MESCDEDLLPPNKMKILCKNEETMQDLEIHEVPQPELVTLQNTITTMKRNFQNFLNIIGDIGDRLGVRPTDMEMEELNDFLSTEDSLTTPYMERVQTELRATTELNQQLHESNLTGKKQIAHLEEQLVYFKVLLAEKSRKAEQDLLEKETFNVKIRDLYDKINEHSAELQSQDALNTQLLQIIGDLEMTLEKPTREEVVSLKKSVSLESNIEKHPRRSFHLKKSKSHEQDYAKRNRRFSESDVFDENGTSLAEKKSMYASVERLENFARSYMDTQQQGTTKELKQVQREEQKNKNRLHKKEKVVQNLGKMTNSVREVVRDIYKELCDVNRLLVGGTPSSLELPKLGIVDGVVFIQDHVSKMRMIIETIVDELRVENELRQHVLVMSKQIVDDKNDNDELSSLSLEMGYQLQAIDEFEKRLQRVEITNTDVRDDVENENDAVMYSLVETAMTQLRKMEEINQKVEKFDEFNRMKRLIEDQRNALDNIWAEEFHDDRVSILGELGRNQKNALENLKKVSGKNDNKQQNRQQRNPQFSSLKSEIESVLNVLNDVVENSECSNSSSIRSRHLFNFEGSNNGKYGSQVSPGSISETTTIDGIETKTKMRDDETIDEEGLSFMASMNDNEFSLTSPEEELEKMDEYLQERHKHQTNKRFAAVQSDSLESMRRELLDAYQQVDDCKTEIQKQCFLNMQLQREVIEIVDSLRAYSERCDQLCEVLEEGEKKTAQLAISNRKLKKTIQALRGDQYIFGFKVKLWAGRVGGLPAPPVNIINSCVSKYVPLFRKSSRNIRVRKLIEPPSSTTKGINNGDLDERNKAENQ